MSLRDQKKKRPARGRTENAGGLSGLLTSVLTAIPLTVLTGLCFLFPATALLLSAKDPGRLSLPVALCLMYLTAFCGGMIVSRLHGKRSPILTGGVLGLVLLAALLLFSLVAPQAWSSAALGGWKHGARLLILPAVILGALFAARKKKRARHR